MHVTQASHVHGDRFAVIAEGLGVVGRWLRMSAKDQRAVFGAYLFGRKEIFVDTRPPGKVVVQWSTSFGQDFERVEFSFADIAAAVATNKTLSF